MLLFKLLKRSEITEVVVLATIIISPLFSANVLAGNNMYGVPVVPAYKTGDLGSAVGGSVPGERIDPNSGRMYHETADMVIPGNGGMDIVISRAYQKNSLPNYSVPHAMGNWEFMLPTITRNSGGVYASWYREGNNIGSLGDASKSTEFKGCQMPRPGGILLFTNYIPNTLLRRPWWGMKLNVPGQPIRDLLYAGASSLQNYGNDAFWVTNDGWKSGCIGVNKYNDMHEGFVVYSPSNQRYIFDLSISSVKSKLYDVSTNSFVVQWVDKEQYFPSKVEDKNGNWINYEYIEENRTYSTYSSYYNRLSKITASDGRIVNFSYLNPIPNLWQAVRPSYLIDKIEYNGRIIQYHYDQEYQLEKVTLPNGNEINYQYLNDPKDEYVALGSDGKGNWNTDKPVLKSILLPTGGKVEYTYEDRIVSSMGGISTSEGQISQEKYPAIKSKTLTGPDITTGVWTYTYSQDSQNVVNRTRVAGPVHDAEYDFQRDTSLANAPPWGVMVAKRLYDPGETTPIEVMTQQWQKFSPIGMYTPVGLNNIFANNITVGSSGHSDDQQSARIKAVIEPYRAKETLIVRNTSQFKTILANFDLFFNAQSIISSSTTGGISASKTESLKFKNVNELAPVTNQATWFVGLPEETKVDGAVVSSMIYDTKGNLTSTSKHGVNANYTYTPEGDVATSTDANANGVQYENYAFGKAQKTTNAAGDIATATIDIFGNVIAKTDFRGNITSYEYDAINRLVRDVPPTGNETTIDYTNENEVVTSTGNLKSTAYRDGWGRTIKTKVEDVISTGPAIMNTMTYGPAGRKLFASDAYYEGEGAASIYGTSYQYDALNRLLSTTHSGNQATTTISWNDDTHSSTTTDPNGNSTTRRYRSYGNPADMQLMKEEAPEQVVLDINRDVYGKVLSVNVGSHQRSYTYNANQFMTSVTIPEIGTTTFSHDAVGNVLSKTIGASATINYNYDALDQIVKVDYPQATTDVDYAYDPDGNLISQTKGNSTWNYTYDGNNNQISAKLNIENKTLPFLFAYDGLNSLTSLTYPSGESVAYAPDALGRPQQVGSYITSIGYHPDGTTSQLNFANGQISTLTQDTNKRPDKIEIGALGATQAANLDYSYDLSGNLSQLYNGVTSDYRNVNYDGLHRISSMATSFGSGAIQYDVLGNITSKNIDGDVLNYAYAANDRLESVSGDLNLSFSYDQHGNVVQRGAQTYLFDDADNLITANGPSLTSFQYDGNGRMVIMEKASKTYSAYLSEEKLVELNVDEGWLKERIYLGTRIIVERTETDLASVDTDSDGINDQLEWQAGLSITDPQDATGDLDGDGLSNAQEAELGTDLTVADIDTDGDGLFDSQELSLGTNPALVDTDGDGLSDSLELTAGTNPLLSDTDADGLSDGQEQTAGTNPLVSDTDGDGVSDGQEQVDGTNPLLVDSDGDGLSDSEEKSAGTAPLVADTDGDGLSDGEELSLGTNPLMIDTDNDGLSDAQELIVATNPLLSDTDADGVTDGQEQTAGTNPLVSDTDGDGVSDGQEQVDGTNPLLADSDGDGLSDSEEKSAGTAPLVADTDGDGLSDGQEQAAGTNPLQADTDGDGVLDAQEQTNGTNPLLADTDTDGLSDGEEQSAGTDPLVADTDGDGLLDGQEKVSGTNPLLADTDGDGLSDSQEQTHGTDPLLADSDGDGLTDGDEVAVGRNPLLNEAVIIVIINSLLLN